MRRGTVKSVYGTMLDEKGKNCDINFYMLYFICIFSTEEEKVRRNVYDVPLRPNKPAQLRDLKQFKTIKNQTDRW